MEAGTSVSAALLRNFAKEVAFTGIFKNISSRNIMHLASDRLVTSGGNKHNSLYESTIRGAKKKAAWTNADKYREDV